MKSKMVAPVDQGGSTLKLFDKEPEIMCLVGVVKLFYASFGDDAAVVCLFELYTVRFDASLFIVGATPSCSQNETGA